MSDPFVCNLNADSARVRYSFIRDLAVRDFLLQMPVEEKEHVNVFLGQDAPSAASL